MIIAMPEDFIKFIPCKEGYLVAKDLASVLLPTLHKLGFKYFKLSRSILRRLSWYNMARKAWPEAKKTKLKDYIIPSGLNALLVWITFEELFLNV